MDTKVIQAFYGDGRGKTSAAVGQALRVCQDGWRIMIIQFLKGKEPDEFQILSRLEPEVQFFRFDKSEVSYCELSIQEREQEKQNILNGFNFAKKVIETGESDIIILDELLGLVDLGIVEQEDLVSLLTLEGDDKKLYVTGNQLDEALVPHIDVICRISQEKDNA